MLNIYNHDRDAVHLTYIYPVVSRRAGGLSIGVNLNPNNRCNWQCVYCQVPDLQRGVAPIADLALLEQELDGFLTEVIHGDYMHKQVPEEYRSVCDIAISGNGEPTTCSNFSEVVSLIVRLMEKYGLRIPLRLITNGSAIHKAEVQSGLELMRKHHGEVWFKVDAIGEELTQAINGVTLASDWQLKQLKKSVDACATWLQTCIVRGQNDSEVFEQEYIGWLEQVKGQGIRIEGVLLYSLARPSMQENGGKLKAVDSLWLQAFAQKIESLGISAKVS